MRVSFQEIAQRVDWWMISSVLCLSGVGLLVIRSLTWPEDDRFLRQGLFLIIGLIIFIGVQFLDINFWRNASLIIYLSIIVLLIGLILFGDATRGTRGWIMIGSFGIQPAEFAKIATVLFLATTLERLRFDLAKINHVILALAIIGVPFILTVIQPDLGSAFIILLSGLIMVLYTGLDKKKLLALLIVAIIAVLSAWFIFLQDYQRTRILTFLNPQSDPLGSGYNVTQSIVAIGSGGVFGRGLGLGPQSQLNFLPEQETDFIFASLAEETGFLGSILVLIVFAFFFFRLERVLSSGTHAFQNFLVLGILSMFLVQTVVNIAMNMGMFPVTGVTLPFISYGGSSLVSSFWGLGIVMTSRS
ncbi:MAG: rod shape-determining protein RodA [Parcubacteria group bacterium CG_4_9_14_0_2_um_filter_41_8]|nr:MAG: rod shape-determining protein RodA [Parcubacteria group bacterium CG22_combo_CG10-13_8_21_14_all_41_9]PIQ79156.1 MAG: rod shape-determining protein RodA [Parcubacteria group bacterium CG11_big_fil_rev_8_21_14_0_20_41_14]PIR56763.1 MAG: rod shape-determining protein RodA [Parcubacteria group bacterium CG10_big_fil_rev_8_21_14_0_10_41_35]PIZ80939.1 MAG: rod shape-determining protein RodA [Parcubacteria group bacterium CG_4_10_14_0_2_um_filter_41_6]PJC40600.1 MAG: rod shape-determining pro